MLSVCCLSGVPRRLMGLLPLMRGVADEIVVALDDRVGAGLIRPVAELSDRVFLVPYADPPERTFQWLHEQTSGDWVFRIDDDEAPSRALLDALAAPPDDVSHCFVPRRWLWGEGWLDAFPWHPDWQLRLGRRDALQFPGLMHVPVRGEGPARFLEAPLYHLDLLENDRDAREAKVRRYEALRPGLRIAGRPLSEAYYVPESRNAPIAAIAPEDLALVRAVREARMLPVCSALVLPTATREEIDGRWAAAPLPEDGYRARLQVDAFDPLTAGEVREFDVRVTNLGSATWAHGARGLPEIRLSYQGLSDALRTPLPHDLGPGAEALVPVAVRAPADPGRYPITLDLVHEGHRWFGCGVKVTLDVQARRRAAVLVGQPPGEASFDARVDDVLARLDPSLEPLLVGPKPDWLRDRFGVEASAEPPRDGPFEAVFVVPAGRRRDRLRLEILARRLGRNARR